MWYDFGVRFHTEARIAFLSQPFIAQVVFKTVPT